MKELSLHILDIAQNSITANCNLLQITVNEDSINNRLTIEIRDDGIGMSKEMLQRVTDPFTTTRTTRKVGMGIPLLKEATQECGGSFAIDSTLGVGTRVSAVFQYDHIDRQPLGDMAETIPVIIGNCEETDLIYIHKINGKEFVLDTREIRSILGDEVSLSSVDVLIWIREFVDEGLKEII